MARILVLNGPNLNLLGQREPALYGSATLAEVEQKLIGSARARGHDVVAFQSNAEHDLIEKIHAARLDGSAFILINPGAFTHTSIAMRDALLAVGLPFIEIHITNVFAREEFRHRSYLSGIAVGCIVGLGVLGYELALESACSRLAAA